MICYLIDWEERNIGCVLACALNLANFRGKGSFKLQYSIVLCHKGQFDKSESFHVRMSVLGNIRFNQIRFCKQSKGKTLAKKNSL